LIALNVGNFLLLEIGNRYDC